MAPLVCAHHLLLLLLGLVLLPFFLLVPATSSHDDQRLPEDHPPSSRRSPTAEVAAGEEALEGLCLRAAAGVQQGLAARPAVRLPPVRVGGGRARGASGVRRAHARPRRRRPLLRPRLRLLQLQHGQRVPSPRPLAASPRLRRRPRLLRFPLLEPIKGPRPCLRRLPRLRRMLPRDGGRGRRRRDTGVHEGLHHPANLWRDVARPPLPEGRARADSALRVSGRGGPATGAGDGETRHIRLLPRQDGSPPEKHQRPLLRPRRADGDLAAVRREPKVLPPAETIHRVPIGDRAVGLLPLPAGLGALEPPAGGGGSAGVRAGYHRRRDTPAVPGGGPVAGDIPVGAGVRCREARGGA